MFDWPEARRAAIAFGRGAIIINAGPLVALLAAAIYYFSPTAASVPAASSTVLISAGTGQGTGVHIGRGYVVTAAHVVTGAGPEFKVTDSAGAEHARTVLWTNTEYDLALLRVEGHAGLGQATVRCSPVIAPGQRITATGNPINLSFITVRGYIASDVARRGAWKQLFVVDMAVVPGMSGGPVFDDGGSVIGIMVGVASVTTNPTSVSLVGLGYVVPSSAICDLLARK